MTRTRSLSIAGLGAIIAIIIVASGCSGSGSSAGNAAGSTTTTYSTAKDITTLNGTSLPGRMLPLQDTVTMLDTVDANGLRLYITRGTRLAGTRVAIHTHEYGGHTCVLTGVITDFVEGMEPETHPAGSCYYMPPDTLMSAANLGTEDAVLIDTFNLPEGVPAITIREPGYPDS
jgi:quercetin dioxygenase-like cupin family protein